jgi:hypothetical protein
MLTNQIPSGVTATASSARLDAALQLLSAHARCSRQPLGSRAGLHFRVFLRCFATRAFACSTFVFALTQTTQLLVDSNCSLHLKDTLLRKVAVCPSCRLLYDALRDSDALADCFRACSNERKVCYPFSIMLHAYCVESFSSASKASSNQT